MVTDAERDIGEALLSLADAQPTAPALHASGRDPLTYFELAAQIRDVRDCLRAWGIARGDVVAGFVASRPEMAVACATFPCSSTLAPLGRSLTVDAYIELLRRLVPKAVLVPAQDDHALIVAARALNLAEIRMRSDNSGPAGRFSLELARPTASLDAESRLSPEYAYVMVTSGTTGRPKLVPHEHDQLLYHAGVMKAWFRTTTDDVGCHIVPLHLSHGIRNGLAVPLLGGHSILCLEEGDVEAFFRAFDEARPTYLTAGFTLYRALLARAPEHRLRLARSRLRFLRVGTGRLETHEIDALEQAFGVPVIKGLTLTEGVASQDPLPPRARKKDALGLPLGSELAILSASGEWAPSGASGEIVMRGPSVCRGYIDDPELNAQSFTDGWFRTGDEGYLDDDGYLYLTGRIKEMINRGGEKFSPPRIDAALQSFAGVKEAAAFGVPHPRLGEEVVAAVVCEANVTIEADAIIAHARSRLGLAGAPRRIYFVDRLPRNETGKVRRAELPRWVGVEADTRENEAPAASEAAPLSPLETAVAALFSSTLGRRDLGVHDDFFLSGGDSLAGAQLIAQVRAVFGVDVSARVLFGEAATIAGMARVIERMRSGASGAPAATAPELLRADREPTVLSHTQRRAWFLGRLDPQNAAYNEVRVHRLTGALAVPALRESLGAIVRRHDILRTVYAMVDGEPKQFVDDRATPELELADLSGVAPENREAALQALVTSLANGPFNLEAGPLARFTLVRLSDLEHALVRVWHHIVGDGWSAAVFERDLSAGYNAIVARRPDAIPALPMQYGDYAAQQVARSGSAALQRQLDDWIGRLADLSTLRLPTDRARPAIQSYRGARIERHLSKSVVNALTALGRSAGATPFMTALAIFVALLHRYTGDDDIAVGTPIAGRTRTEFEGLIGFFANTLVLRISAASEPTFLELLGRVRETALDAYTNQEVPFERLVEALAPARDPSRHPLFQVCFALQSVPLTELALDGIEVRRVTPPTVHAKFDLTLMLRPAEGGMTASWEYCADLFDGSTIERMATHFETMLRAVVTDPRQPIGRIPMLSAHERASLLAWSGAPVGDPPPACVHELFEAQAAATPDAIAIADAGATLTYRQLNARANRLAHYLRAQGVERGQRVGVCLERSPALIFTLLAILKSGAAYVPLDPDVPADRLAFMLDDAGASTVVMRETLSAGLAHAPCRVLRLDVERAAIAEQPADDESLRTQPSDLACVMYTSGSTGAPKGVAVPHRAIVRLVRATDYMQLGAGDVVAQLSNPAFDAATFEIWGALLNGARIELIPRDTMLAPRALADALKRHSVTTVFLTTALFNQLAREAPAAFSACRDVLFGGEAVDPKAVAAILRDEPPQRLLHVYGPTETTTFATWHLVTAVEDAARTVPIGGPIGYTEVYVLDRYGEPVPIGVAGEIHIGGPGLALGYLGQPQLTAERFIPHPFTSSGARLYRTGDRARYRPDGAIEFLGRLDRQVKIRGHRVEPGEVEAALLRLPDVREAVVIVRGDSAEARQMIAYVASATGAHPAPAQLMSELRRSLPQYMLPSAIVVLDALPLNRHGKVDRRALPDPSDIAEGRTGAHAPPRDPLEHMLAGIWEELLGVRNVGVNDSFFDLGGHSLLAAQMMDAVERACGRSVPLTILFGAATIAELSRALAGKTEASREPVIAVNGDGGRPPFFFLHGDYSGGGFYSRELSRALGADQPFYAVHPHGLIDAQVPDSIEAMAADRLRAVRAVQPNGPYALGGHCNGALVAFEMARLLVEQGEEVPVVIVLDAKAPWRSVRVFPGISLGEEREKSPRAIQGADVPVASPPDTTLLYRRAIAAYMPRRYPGRLVVLRSQANQDLRESLGWSGMASVIETYAIPGNHHTSITRHVAETGARIRSCLDEAFSERPVQAQVQIR